MTTKDGTLPLRSAGARGRASRRGAAPVAPRSRTQEIYDEIKRDITRCVHRPGQALHEAELAARHRVSKTPVREALNLLANEGWVAVVPRLGYMVQPMSVRDVQDVFQLRLLLEPAAAALAAERIDEERLRDLRRLSRIEYTHGERESYSNFLAANREFHTAVARASGNRRLGDLVARLLEEMERFFHLGLDIKDSSGEMVHEHSDLVEALVAGDSHKAAGFMREQITASRRRVIDAILSDDGDQRALLHVL